MQMGLAMAGFLFAVLLLEPDALVGWSHHLELGPLRSAAIPATESLAKAMHPTGFYRIREGALANLAHVGWSDDATGSRAASPAVTNASPASLSRTACSPVSGAATPTLHAAGAETPLVRDVPRVTPLPDLAPLAAGKVRTVALAGDSMMAVGLSSELMREAASDKHLHIVKAFRSGTGLARPDVFDWMTEYPAMLGEEKPDVVLVAIGANDGQGFVEDGKTLAFGSADWEKVYQARVANYLAMVSNGGARVVWIGLPPMRAASYDDKMATINKIAFTVVNQTPGASWWNPLPFVGDDGGHYREFAAGAKGNVVKIRQGDGIHLSDEGAALLMPTLLTWLDPPPAPASSSATAASSAPARPVAIATATAPLAGAAAHRRRRR